MKKTGINTNTPTEIFDVNGTLRVRTIDNNTGSINGTSGLQEWNSLAASNDTYNVIGVNNNGNMVPLVNSSSKDTSNASSSMFVIKRFKIGDWPSQNGNVGINTGMSSKKWSAIMSNVGYTFTVIDDVNDVFKGKHLMEWGLFDNGTTWRIYGDIKGVQEKSDFVDILFINKAVVAQMTRTTSSPY